MKPWRLAVRALVIDPADRVLLVRFQTGVWTTPGGGIDAAETDEQALRREFAEKDHRRNRSTPGSIRACRA